MLVKYSVRVILVLKMPVSGGYVCLLLITFGISKTMFCMEI